jgi:hypothetical protein
MNMIREKINARDVCCRVMRSQAAALVCVVALILPAIAQATVITVPGDFPSIVSAVNAATGGDEVIVSPGTYQESISFDGKNIVLRSTNPASWSVAQLTVIRGAIQFAGSESSACVLEGFTMRDAQGIYGNGTKATIQHNTITGNSKGGGYSSDGAPVTGGGIDNCDGLIQYNIICYNAVYNAWVPYGAEAHPLFPVAWPTYAFGSGLANCDGTIRGNLIYRNGDPDYFLRGDYVSAGGLYNCTGTIVNNTICKNDLGGICESTAAIRNCLIWENFPELSYTAVPEYSCIRGGAAGAGNIADDPRFVDLANDDYHLRADSPCIDAGRAVTGADFDLDGNPRPIFSAPDSRGDGSGFDIGAYEFAGVAEPSPTPTSTPTPTPTPSPTPEPYVEFSFDADAQGWVAVTNVPPLDQAVATWTAGSLGLSPNGSAGAFGFWQSPKIPISFDKVYRTRWMVGASTADADLTPKFRLRANELSNDGAWLRMVNSFGGAAPSLGASKTYDMLISPLSKTSVDDLILAFDTETLDPEDDLSAWLYLDNVELQAVTVATTGTTAAQFNFDADANGWYPLGQVPPFAKATAYAGNGKIGLSPNGSAYSFGCWQSPEITVEKGKIYRARFNASSDRTNADDVPLFRFRGNQLSNWGGWVRIINSRDGAAPTATQSRNYDLYISPQMESATDSIILCFDLLSINPADALDAYVYVDSVTVQEVVIEE